MKATTCFAFRRIIFWCEAETIACKRKSQNKVLQTCLYYRLKINSEPKNQRRKAINSLHIPWLMAFSIQGFYYDYSIILPSLSSPNAVLKSVDLWYGVERWSHRKGQRIAVHYEVSERIAKLWACEIAIHHCSVMTPRRHCKMTTWKCAPASTAFCILGARDKCIPRATTLGNKNDAGRGWRRKLSRCFWQTTLICFR